MIESINDNTINEDTIIVYVNGDPIYFWSIQPDLKDMILKNQKTATDLEKRIDKFMTLINILQDGDPENEDPKPILDFAEECFGDIDLE